MKLNSEFIEAVNNKKKFAIRIMIKDSMLVDPTLKLCNEMLNYAENKILGLYDNHDGEILEKDKNYWTEDYLNMQMVKLVNNFSKERIELIKKIVDQKFNNENKLKKLCSEIIKLIFKREL
ncbi:hypothetical protein [Sneathia sanguinegens]|uniref:hypothetical protein n=1 Tax=Sneathia sanguinegens TaxID=40543 RepID=UPI0025884BDD|nr:hypothetical protein [Sneathia sanguinegens]MDU4651880.1 hypothetical protein [Sneathia sanguinegens]